MGEVVTVARSVYGRFLYLLLLPFVFLITLVQEGSPVWRGTIVNTVGFIVLMTLGLTTVYVIHGRF